MSPQIKYYAARISSFFSGFKLTSLIIDQFRDFPDQRLGLFNFAASLTWWRLANIALSKPK
jgi:hypothetical protein